MRKVRGQLQDASVSYFERWRSGLVLHTYIDRSDDDHVGAVEFQPHLLDTFPELSTALGTLPVHLHDVQPG